MARFPIPNSLWSMLVGLVSNLRVFPDTLGEFLHLNPDFLTAPSFVSFKDKDNACGSIWCQQEQAHLVLTHLNKSLPPIYIPICMRVTAWLGASLSASPCLCLHRASLTFCFAVVVWRAAPYPLRQRPPACLIPLLSTLSCLQRWHKRNETKSIQCKIIWNAGWRWQSIPTTWNYQ